MVYWNILVSVPASKDDLVPPVPVLTRYKKETAIKVFVKKELFESKLPEERRSINIDVPATAMLCVQLNTLHVTSRLASSVQASFSSFAAIYNVFICFLQYAVSQLSKLEDSMWERWIAKKPREKIVISMDHLCACSMLKSHFPSQNLIIKKFHRSRMNGTSLFWLSL